MRKRITVLLLLLLLIFPSHAGASSVGDVVGYIYSTDIVAYVDGMLIPSYNIGGKTVIIAEDLIDYGFEVNWNGELRELSIYTAEMPTVPPVPNISSEALSPGQIVGDVYYSDITVNMNNVGINAYNIGGKTAIAFDEIGGNLPVRNANKELGYTMNGFREVWDGKARISYLEVLRKGSSVELNGNRYLIQYLDYYDKGTNVELSRVELDGTVSLIGTGTGMLGDETAPNGYFPESLLRQIFGDRWHLDDGRLTLDLRGKPVQISPSNADKAHCGVYTFYYGASNAFNPTLIPYIMIPTTVIQDTEENMYEWNAVIVGNNLLIDMSALLSIL